MGDYKAGPQQRAEVWARIQDGETQKALAEEYGVSRQTVARWCRQAARDGAYAAAVVTGGSPRVMPTTVELLPAAHRPQLPDPSGSSEALTAASLARQSVRNLAVIAARHGDPAQGDNPEAFYEPKLSAWCSDRILHHLTKSGIMQDLQGHGTQLRVSLLSEAELYGWTLLSEALDELARMAAGREMRPAVLPDAERSRWEELVRRIQVDVLGGVA